jgi:anti-sigma factor RsiW
MTCTETQLALSDLVDGTLPRDARSRVEAHLDTCADCRAVLADLRHIRESAKALPKVPAPEALWQKVRADFEARQTGQAGSLPRRDEIAAASASAKAAGTKGEHTGLPHEDAASGRRVLSFLPRRRSVLAGLAAAAALVLATSAGVYYATRPVAPAPQVAPAAAHVQPSESVQSIESELQLAVQHYQNAITGLEKVATDGQAVLEPETAAVLAKNNAILDQAVTESQAALRTQPTSEVARASLFEALQRKVTLLRDTIALINEMRKGDQAGTARVVGGLGKS